MKNRRNSKSIIKVDTEATKHISFQEKAWKSLPVPNQATVKSSQSVRTANTTTLESDPSYYATVKFINEVLIKRWEIIPVQVMVHQSHYEDGKFSEGGRL
eukprot:CAMPEP_0194228442 /NCGR_PEP_ID=MMETSP0156-20130528/43378_1 /TAXON_ID=33649 /ORGANISM="Thalassionema nitzschioides, Strain L26-B" /LENGTH=99 /DNA_ID=CAMNT_0038960955 /DNA_START=614 /DNA_END=913 /DNA_ORIENTATION=-